MAVNINYFKEYCFTIINKVQSGYSITEAQGDILFNQSQQFPYDQDYDIFVKSEMKTITQYLNTFLKKKVSLSVDSEGNAPVPSDYLHTASMRRYYVRPDGQSVFIRVRSVSNDAWGDIQISSLNKPIPRFSKFTEYSNYFSFDPKSGIYQLDYFKVPVAPIWNFTIEDDTAVYNSVGSVNYEFDEFAVNRVAGWFIYLFGKNVGNELIAKTGAEMAQISMSL
jgi:hypothetical protein